MSHIAARPARGLVLAEAGEFSGYASLFGLADLGGDVVAPGAFAESLARRGPSGIRMLWQHDPAEPVGRWLDLAEDGRGLRVRGRLNPGVGRARELAALLAGGDIDGLSIGFRVVEARGGRGTPRRLARLDLWEISLVTFPMQPAARVIRPPARPTPSAPALAGIILAASRRFSSVSPKGRPSP